MGMVSKKVIVSDDCNKNNSKLLYKTQVFDKKKKTHSNVLYSLKGMVIGIISRV